MAPVGAAAYSARETADGASIIFAMIKTDESGQDALIRIRKMNTGITWTPTTARPSEQWQADPDGSEFKRVDLKYENGVVIGATEDTRDYMETIRRIGSLPVAAPRGLEVTLEAWRTKNERGAGN